MRKELQPLEGRRITVMGTFIRFGMFETKWGLQRKVLLKNIRDIRGKRLAQHISLSEPSDVRVFEGFNPGEIIQFSAIVCSYIKGYRGEDLGLRLARPICVDYGIRDIQELRSVSRDIYRKKEVSTTLMEELSCHKRISLGIC